MSNCGVGTNIFPSWAQRAAASSLLTGLNHYWKLDETSGTRADSVGGVTLQDNVTVGFAVGKNNNAASFTFGDADYLSYDSPLILPSYTIACWFKTADVTNLLGICTFGGVSSPFGFAGSLYTGNTSRIDFRVGDGSTLSGAAVLTNVRNNAWHLVVAIYDASTKKAYLSVDNSALSAGAALTGTKVSSTLFYIGHRDLGIGACTGDIDEFGVWNRVLTTDEITELYNAGAGKFYPFS